RPPRPLLFPYTTLFRSYALTLTQTTQQLVTWVGSLDFHPLVIMAIILAIYVILGLFLDQIAILILTVPILLPVVLSLGFDPIWLDRKSTRLNSSHVKTS